MRVLTFIASVALVAMLTGQDGSTKKASKAILSVSN